jgi:hypothetical protein
MNRDQFNLKRQQRLDVPVTAMPPPVQGLSSEPQRGRNDVRWPRVVVAGDGRMADISPPRQRVEIKN